MGRPINPSSVVETGPDGTKYVHPAGQGKTCKGCGEIVPFDRFTWHRNTNGMMYRGARCKPCMAKKVRLTARQCNLKRRYGITKERYVEMHDGQGGACAICRERETIFDSRYQCTRPLSVDHCHATKKVRGLLCDRCNKALGVFKERPELLDAAAAYLRLHHSV